MDNEKRRFNTFDDVLIYFDAVDNSMAEAICFLACRLKLISELSDVDFDWNKLLAKKKNNHRTP